MALKTNRKLTPSNDALLMESLHHYNAQYENQKYNDAVDSISGDTDELCRANLGVQLSDVALSLCGSPYHSGIVQMDITPEVVIFWQSFIS